MSTPARNLQSATDEGQTNGGVEARLDELGKASQSFQEALAEVGLCVQDLVRETGMAATAGLLERIEILGRLTEHLQLRISDLERPAKRYAFISRATRS